MTAQNEQNAWQDYLKILNSGVFYECHPTLTGCWEIDKDEFIDFWVDMKKNRPIPQPTGMIREGVKPIKNPINLVTKYNGIKPHSFCETPKEKCTLNYCDDNGCQNRKRNNVDTPITPAHYGGSDNTYEAIKVIEAWGLNFSLGNVIKYISRAGKKENTTALQDLLKAKKYLEFEIAKHEALHS